MDDKYDVIIIGTADALADLCRKKLADYVAAITLPEEAQIIVNLQNNTLVYQDTIVKTGLIKLPYPQDLKLNIGLLEGIVPSLMAEPILLALEERPLNYSFGDTINPARMEEIADFSTRCGFEVWVPEAPIL